MIDAVLLASFAAFSGFLSYRLAREEWINTRPRRVRVIRRDRTLLVFVNAWCVFSAFDCPNYSVIDERTDE